MFGSCEDCEELNLTCLEAEEENDRYQGTVDMNLKKTALEQTLLKFEFLSYHMFQQCDSRYLEKTLI